ncbi:TraR/DksA C4-type zinc finger protein [Ruminiclostridium cellobioparum]|jgi:YteA family regulatory protein|uniref:DnaK suppressor protein n=1 Tax=Ruminiclostridium cellobioparum subsp. termitidis CT1112 TaxID=1195236 RepID=S0FNA9_RUMCE|nr:TraR/DksA C4-type zinc finger protein [Ruminiclostridium cellobioparum]EMS73347.1 DnaK suppressor protein [Ruminiclostridium cellobioparum subsp. termitidis CT1112]
MEKYRLDQLKGKLKEQEKQMINTIKTMHENGDADMSEHYPTELSNYDNHPADHGTELYILELNMALKVHEQTKLNDIQKALKKIDNGTYGICEHCQREIDFGRLNAKPSAGLCYECEMNLEAKEINTADQQYGEIFDSPFGRKYLNKQEDDEFEGIDILNDVLKYGSSDSPQDMGGYADFEEYYTNELDNQGIVEEIDKISNQQYKDQLP